MRSAQENFFASDLEFLLFCDKLCIIFIFKLKFKIGSNKILTLVYLLIFATKRNNAKLDEQCAKSANTAQPFPLFDL
jgi:hypothetical protein